MKLDHKQRLAFNELIRTGSAMSNICYNFSHHNSVPAFSKTEQTRIGALVREWDAHLNYVESLLGINRRPALNNHKKGTDATP